MKGRIRFYILLMLFVLGGVTSSSVFVFGQVDDSDVINKEIKLLNDDISDRKNQVKDIQKKQEKYSQAIEEKQAEKASLNNQLALLDNRTAKAELDIELVEVEIDRTKLEIQKTDAEIKNKNEEIEQEKTHISNVLKLMSKRDNVGSLEIMLLNDSLADFLGQVKYLEDINESIEEGLKKVEKLKRGLEKEKVVLAEQNEDLEQKKAELKEKQEKYLLEKEQKVTILDQVNTSEKEYQRLLAKAKQEQDDAASEIANMEKVVRAKLAQLEGDDLQFNDNGLIWPVTKNVITAYFHDPDYPFKYIFEHPAIDIRAGHGSPLKAAASGYVARVVRGYDGGYGYIMLIHGDGLSTVYGHISDAYVKEDEYVVQGQSIGLSGGLPGTPGAGRLTTGPHLHFEVRLNGIPVDPLNYLP